MNLLMLFAPSPIVWIVVLAVVLLLFGSSRLPKLAKALGESKRALKEGLTGRDETEHR